MAKGRHCHNFLPRDFANENFTFSLFDKFSKHNTVMTVFQVKPGYLSKKPALTEINVQNIDLKGNTTMARNYIFHPIYAIVT